MDGDGESSARVEDLDLVVVGGDRLGETLLLNRLGNIDRPVKALHVFFHKTFLTVDSCTHLEALPALKSNQCCVARAE